MFRRLVGAAVCCRRASSGVVARPPVARAAPASAQTLQDPHKRQYAAAGTACHPIGPSGAHAVRSVHSSAQHMCAGGVEVGASDEAAGSSSTHFGFQTVATGQKQTLVRQVFSRVATQYDLMNDVMSGGLHRWWKDEFVRRLGPFATGTRARVLDVAGGTGDTAFRIADLLCHHGVPREEVEGITVCDINEDMLAEGKRRYEAGSYSSRVQHLWPRLDFVQGDAQCLPFDDATMDVYTISFGIRNVTSVEAALSEAFRVLKPGGRFMCLEFSHVPNAALQAAYDLYSFQVIPQLGQLVAGDRDSYQYLVESIRRFPTQHQFATLIHEAGFRCVSYENFTGGIVAVHSGFKPLRAD